MKIFDDIYVIILTLYYFIKFEGINDLQENFHPCVEIFQK